ncbi:MAG: discoidin domain-containing protein, partial [Clostridia bacterium]|nr:discoidin domain-containing protein [Clostridia bacterium]
DYTNRWTLPSTNPEFEVVLDDVKEISEIQLTWGFNYAKAYTVEVSLDGYEYTKLVDVTEGLGDEEIIKLDEPQEAQYIRFSGFEKAQKALSELTDIRIYSTDMDYVGVCDITGNISVEKENEEDNFTDFEEDKNSDKEDVNSSEDNKEETSPGEEETDDFDSFDDEAEDDTSFEDSDSEATTSEDSDSEATTSSDDDDDKSDSSWMKKVIRRKFIPGGLDWWVILIIVIASVAVLAGAGITIFIVIRKKKAKSKK